MRSTVLALLLLAGNSSAERGHQAYRSQLQRSAKAHEEWINKPCTPRGRYLANVKQRLGGTTLWTIRLHTTGYWRITLNVFQVTRSGCDRSRARHVHVHWN